MADIDLTVLDLSELKKLRKDVDKAIADFEDRKRREARAAAEAIAKEAGFTLAELVGTVGTKGRKSVSLAKYQHPENPALTWTGRGRQPAWFKELTEAGMPADELLIAS